MNSLFVLVGNRLLSKYLYIECEAFLENPCARKFVPLVGVSIGQLIYPMTIYDTCTGG